MERIKQALERARAERAAGTAVSGGRALAPAVEPAAPPTTEPAAPQITYTKTKVVEVSARDLAKRRVISAEQRDEISMAYAVLRTQVLQRMTANGWNALAVTSADPGAGKTLTAVNLAISLAREVTHTVLLVDLDLRRPKIHTCLGLAVEHGISDFLLKDVPITEILVNPGIERLVVLPGREPILNSAEMLRSPKMVKLVEELKSRYPSRFVIFDLPPVLAADDALGFSPYVDAILLVVEEGQTTKEGLQRVADLLQKTPILGTVLNKSTAPVTPYY